MLGLTGINDKIRNALINVNPAENPIFVFDHVETDLDTIMSEVN